MTQMQKQSFRSEGKEVLRYQYEIRKVDPISEGIKNNSGAVTSVSSAKMKDSYEAVNRNKIGKTHGGKVKNATGTRRTLGQETVNPDCRDEIENGFMNQTSSGGEELKTRRSLSEKIRAWGKMRYDNSQADCDASEMNDSYSAGELCDKPRFRELVEEIVEKVGRYGEAFAVNVAGQEWLKILGSDERFRWKLYELILTILVIPRGMTADVRIQTCLGKRGEPPLRTGTCMLKWDCTTDRCIKE